MSHSWLTTAVIPLFQVLLSRITSSLVEEMHLFKANNSQTNSQISNHFNSHSDSQLNNNNHLDIQFNSQFNNQLNIQFNSRFNNQFNNQFNSQINSYVNRLPSSHLSLYLIYSNNNDILIIQVCQTSCFRVQTLSVLLNSIGVMSQCFLKKRRKGMIRTNSLQM